MNYITLNSALAYVMPYGPYHGKTLAQIAEIETGLHYLKAMVDAGHCFGYTKECIDQVLASEFYKWKLDGGSKQPAKPPA